MLAISHAATALLLKRCFPGASMAGILVAAELPAILWVALAAAGMDDFAYSHSFASILGLACVAWLLLGRLLRRRALGAAAAWAILLHLALDLVLHPEPLALVPLANVHVGVGLYGTPPLAIAAASFYGLACWLVFRGSTALLAALLVLTALELSFAGPIALHVVASIVLVWYLSRVRAAELEHPNQRLARAFA